MKAPWTSVEKDPNSCDDSKVNTGAVVVGAAVVVDGAAVVVDAALVDGAAVVVGAAVIVGIAVSELPPQAEASSTTAKPALIALMI